jgi:antitoxin component of MazEF toxin-antitoxin module
LEQTVVCWREKESKSMARAKKDFRALTVSEATNYGRKTAPMLRIQGLWLQELGFNIGDPVLVKCEDGKLIVMRDPEQTDLDEIEAAFMDKEMKAARKRFKEEKKGICAQYMAERKVGYGA